MDESSFEYFIEHVTGMRENPQFDKLSVIRFNTRVISQQMANYNPRQPKLVANQ